MSGFDTSGEVDNPAWLTPVPTSGQRLLRWSDLSPFVQGYIEAALDAVDQFRSPGFSDLAPKTLKRIMVDCSHVANLFEGLGFKTGATEGARFCRLRNDGALGGVFGAAYPPQTPYFSDDGKVHLREVQP